MNRSRATPCPHASLLLPSQQERPRCGEDIARGPGDAQGAEPTYLLYLAYRSRGELRRIDFEPDCAGATLSDFAASESTRKPLLHTRGISWARSFDLEVAPWAPTRLTSCISHPGPAEASGASTLEPTPH